MECPIKQHFNTDNVSGHTYHVHVPSMYKDRFKIVLNKYMFPWRCQTKKEFKIGRARNDCQ